MKRKLYFWTRKNMDSSNITMAILTVPIMIILVQQILNRNFD